MKTALFSALLLGLGLAAASLAAAESWTGNYTDKKYLNGKAVFQLNILEEGDTISVDGTTLTLGTDVLPFYAPLANRLLPLGASTRSLEGVSVI